MKKLIIPDSAITRMLSNRSSRPFSICMNGAIIFNNNTHRDVGTRYDLAICITKDKKESPINFNTTKVTYNAEKIIPIAFISANAQTPIWL